MEESTMINVIKDISLLKLNEYSDLYKENIISTYNTLMENCSDQKNFQNNSRFIIDNINMNQISNTDAKRWIEYADNILASCLAVKVYENRDQIVQKNAEFILNYFQTGNYSDEITSLGIYACAVCMEISNPQMCYHTTIEAFEKNSMLGSILDINYIYDKHNLHEKYTVECPVCKRKESTAQFCSPQILKLNNRSDFSPSKLWMKCNSCDTIYAYNFPVMDVGNINGHYTGEISNAVLNNRFALDVYNDIFHRCLEFSNGYDYLEVGIGNGEMLAVAQEFGFDTEAVEICRQDCENVSLALNIDIKWCDIVDYQTIKKYDVIIMGDVFEHVIDPVRVLKNVKDMLKDDGMLWLSTPNYNCAYARMQKFTHFMWHELNHYTYVSYESMEKLLSSIGMEIKRYDISRRYIGSMELCIKKTSCQ